MKQTLSKFLRMVFDTESVMEEIRSYQRAEGWVREQIMIDENYLQGTTIQQKCAEIMAYEKEKEETAAKMQVKVEELGFQVLPIKQKYIDRAITPLDRDKVREAIAAFYSYMDCALPEVLFYDTPSDLVSDIDSLRPKFCPHLREKVIAEQGQEIREELMANYGVVMEERYDDRLNDALISQLSSYISTTHPVFVFPELLIYRLKENLLEQFKSQVGDLTLSAAGQLNRELQYHLLGRSLKDFKKELEAKVKGQFMFQLHYGLSGFSRKYLLESVIRKLLFSQEHMYFLGLLEMGKNAGVAYEQRDFDTLTDYLEHVGVALHTPDYVLLSDCSTQIPRI